MISLLRRVRARRNDDSGMGMMTVVLFLGVAAALTVALTSVVFTSLQTTNRDRQSFNALSTAEGGVAQAIQVIRTNPPGFFACHEPASWPVAPDPCASTTNPWISETNPQKVSSTGHVGACDPGAACYAVWISTLHPYNPLPNTDASGTPSHSVVYRIHSTGVSGAGPAARSLEVDISAKLANFPLGVYGDNIQTSGTPGIHHESVFTKNCITGRSEDGKNGGGLSFDAAPDNYDWGYDLPEAAHAASYVSTTKNCTAADSIHSTSRGLANPYCAYDASSGSKYDYFPYDQDAAGGDLTGTPCYNLWTSPVTGKQYAVTSKFTMQDLYAVGYHPQGLTPTEYDALKQQAQAAGTYFNSTPSRNAIQAALSKVTTNGTAVLYIDGTGGTVEFGPGDVPSQFFRASNLTASCTTFASLVVVVRNADMSYNATGHSSSDPSLVASFFVPEGTYSGKGSAQILGTIFASTVVMAGTQDFHMDQCFASNPPSLLLTLSQVKYHEVEDQNIQ
ncbi:MAG TPA: hypothetical protein VF218_10170 [Acidothermaceae bacterium]